MGWGWWLLVGVIAVLTVPGFIIAAFSRGPTDAERRAMIDRGYF